MSTPNAAHVWMPSKTPSMITMRGVGPYRRTRRSSHGRSAQRSAALFASRIKGEFFYGGRINVLRMIWHPSVNTWHFLLLHWGGWGCKWHNYLLTDFEGRNLSENTDDFSRICGDSWSVHIGATWHGRCVQATGCNWYTAAFTIASLATARIPAFVQAKLPAQ